MASKEVQGGRGEGSMIATFFAQVGLAIAIAYLLIAQPASPRPLWWIMGTVMMLEVLFSLFVAHVTMSAPRRQVDSWPE